MKKSIKIPFWSTSLVLIFSLLLFACKTNKTVTESTTKTNQKSLEKSLLWKINGPNIKESYLFGTIHILPESEFALQKGVEEAFAGAEKIILELDMDDPSLQVEMMQYAKMPDGQTLDKLLTEAEYAQLDKWIQKSAGVKLQMVQNLQPILLTALIIGEYLDGPPASYEGSFISMAQAQKKEILGLESVSEQMGAIAEYGIESQVNDMKKMLAAPEVYRESFTQLLAMYKTQDPDGLYDLIETQMSGATMSASLLEKRNKNWVPRIGEFAAEQSCFFAVGSGHLGGEMGMIRLLRAAGYTLTPVQ
ncbi:MAG: TraB/GumN family protein [Bacteroidia bacterium]